MSIQVFSAFDYSEMPRPLRKIMSTGYKYRQERTVDDYALDTFGESDPDLIRINGGLAAIFEFYDNKFVVYKDCGEEEHILEDLLTSFFSEGFDHPNTEKPFWKYIPNASWDVFKSLKTAIAYRGGKGMYYTIWEYQPLEKTP